MLERAIILTPGSALLLEEFGEGGATAAAARELREAARTLADAERDHTMRVLESCDWRVRGPGNAAKQLGLNASTLDSRMKKLGIQRSASTPRRIGVTRADRAP